MEKKIVKAPAKTGIIKYDINSPGRMKAMSVVLKHHIVSNNLYTPIRDKNYAHVEGWQFAGGLLGLFARVVDVDNLSTDKEKKWKADVEIVNLKTDKVVGRGFALCSDIESKGGKKVRTDEYAILSMAQTRAVGKAYRNLLGWVMKLSGYEGTPAEEASLVNGSKETKEQGFKKVETMLNASQNVSALIDYSEKLKDTGCGFTKEQVTKLQTLIKKRVNEIETGSS